MKQAVREQVSTLVEQMRRVRQERIDLEDWGSDMKLGPATSAEEIRAAEKRLKFDFPPSYRAFLELHNGWFEFWPDWSLLGISGRRTDKMLKDANRSMEMYREVLHRDGEQKAEELKQRERKDRKVLYAPHHPIMATDF